jgi:hypothetical protein
MNFLFAKKYTYSVNRSTDDVIEDFVKLTNRKWYDFSENITGYLNPDNTFKLTHKWAFGYVSGFFDNTLVSLTGKLQKNNNETIIEATLKPNFVLVLFLYLIALLFFLEMTGTTKIIEGPKIFTLLFLPFLWLILFGIISFMTNSLRKRFERLLELHRE